MTPDLLTAMCWPVLCKCSCAHCDAHTSVNVFTVCITELIIFIILHYTIIPSLSNDLFFYLKMTIEKFNWFQVICANVSYGSTYSSLKTTKHCSNLKMKHPNNMNASLRFYKNGHTLNNQLF